MFDSLPYSTPYGDDSYDDDISFNMEVSGGRQNTGSLSADPHRLYSLHRSRPPPIETDEFLSRRFKNSSPKTKEEEAYNHKILFSLPKIPSYSEALITSCRHNRERAKNSSIIVGDPPKRIPPRLVRTPVKPLPSVVASGYFRNSMRGIYERQPLFQEFLTSSPEDKTLGYYDLTDIYRLKSDFRDMLSDKYNRLSLKDPSLEPDIGRKLLPWRDQLHREETPSERIIREQSSNRLPSSPLPLPMITVYHRSTRPKWS